MNRRSACRILVGCLSDYDAETRGEGNMNLKLAEPSLVRDGIAFAITLLPGLVVAAALAPKDGMFWTGVMFFCAPQACALGLLFLMFGPPRWPIFAGVSLGLTAYLATFGAWVNLMHLPGPDAWLAYYFAVPGACAGAVVAAVWPGDGRAQSPIRIVGTAAAIVIVGIAISLAAVWSLPR
jgi:hypothetical protein